MEIILTSLLTSLMTGSFMAAFLWYMLRPAPKKKPRKQGKKAPRAQAMNAAAVAVNSTVEDMKIKTAEIEIPVIAEDVLTYEGGELGEAYPERTRLYYAADAIKDPEYIETVLRSPLQMDTHQKNTGEANRAVDGWPREAWWDEKTNRVMVKGIIHGEENVKYAEENRALPGFGTSAYICFLQIDRQPGTAPNGKPYDAIVRKAVNNHIAILPNIRDPKNVIVAMNAVETEKKVDAANPGWVADDATWEKAKEAARKGHPDDFYAVVTDIYKKMGGKISAHGGNSMTKDEFRSAMNEYEAEKRAEDEKAEKIKNAIKNELKEESSKPVTSTGSGGNAETSTSTSTGTGTAGNAPESSGPESAKTSTAETSTGTATNAITPSDDMVKDFATHLGVTIRNPTLEGLASLVGIKATEPAELISALNAKREEFKSRKPSTEAQNSQGSVSLVDALAQF